MNIIRICILALILPFAAACSDDDSETKTPKDPVLELGEDSKPLSELDPDETCQATRQFMEDALSLEETQRAYCLFYGMAFSADQTGCEAFVADCVAQPADASELADSCDYNFENCAATIGDLESCENAKLAMMEALARTLSCADMEAGRPAILDLPESCDRISQCQVGATGCVVDTDCDEGYVCDMEACVPAT